MYENETRKWDIIHLLQGEEKKKKKEEKGRKVLREEITQTMSRWWSGVEEKKYIYIYNNQKPEVCDWPVRLLKIQLGNLLSGSKSRQQHLRQQQRAIWRRRRNLRSRPSAPRARSVVRRERPRKTGDGDLAILGMFAAKTDVAKMVNEWEWRARKSISSSLLSDDGRWSSDGFS